MGFGFNIKSLSTRRSGASEYSSVGMKINTRAVSSIPVSIMLLLLGAATLLYVAFSHIVSAAETGTVSISNITPTVGGQQEPQESGVVHKYRVQFTCQDLSGAGCGATTRLIIPLNKPNVTIPSMINDTGDAGKDWVYTAELTVGGVNAVLSQGIVGDNYVIELNPDVVVNGTSNGLLFNVTPPNFHTLDGTTWDLAPIYQQSYEDPLPADSCTLAASPPAEPNTCEVTAPAITSSATADLQLNHSKTGPANCTANCESYAGSSFTTTLHASCSSTNGSAFGRLLLSSTTITDVLPPGTEYISSTPAGGVYNAGTHTVTWESPPNSFPAGCNNPQVGSAAHTTTVRIPLDATADDTFTNYSSFASPGYETITDEVTTTVKETELDLVKTGPNGCTSNCDVVPDQNFTTTLAVQCKTTFGSPELDVVTVTDELPAGVVYVSSTPGGGVYNPATHTVTWESPPLDVPHNCGTPSLALRAYTTTVYIPANAPHGAQYTNVATASAPGVTPISDEVTAVVRDPATPPGGGGNIPATSGKNVGTPLPGDDTYAGRWLAGDHPASSPEINWNFFNRPTATNTFQMESFEPLTCLEPAGTTLTSPAYTPADGTVPNCTTPAFHPTEYRFNGFAGSGFGTAWLDGWRPQVVMIDGTVIDLDTPRETITAASTGATFFMEDQVPAFNIEEVAMFYIGPHPAMLNGHNNSLYGYADIATPGGTVFQNTYTSIPSFNGTDQTPRVHSNKVDILPTERVLDVFKVNTPTTATTGVFSTWLRGYHKGSTPPENGITMTDLLPVGEELTNIPASNNVLVRLSTSGNISGGIVAEFEVPFVLIDNYQGTGRQAFQYTIPKDDVNTTEYDGIRAGDIYWDAIWNQTPEGTSAYRHPSKYVDDAGTYVNDARIQSIGDTTSNLRCNNDAKIETVPEGYPGAGEVSCVTSHTFTRPPDELKLVSRKTNSPTSGGDGIYNTTIWNYVTSSRDMSVGITVTDLLAIDQEWTNQPTNGMLTVRFCTATNCPGGIQGTVDVPFTVTPDFQGSGRTQIKYTVPPDDPATTAKDGLNEGPQWFVAQVGTANWAMSVPERKVYTNNSTIYSEDPNAEAECLYEGESSTVPAGVPGAGSTSCVSAATYSRLDTGANFDLYKRGTGNQDDFEQDIGGTAHGSLNDSGGNGNFKLTWLNSGSIDIKEITYYDIFAHIGDTGVGAAQANTPRNSTWAPEFNGIVSTTPGTVISYSLSTNPCRPEAFYPAIQPAGCVDDWTTTAPADLKTVKAIKAYNPGTFTPTKTVETVYNLTVPVGAPQYSNAVNTVAGSGKDLGNTPIDATESVKFNFRTGGLPTMSTQAPALVNPGEDVTDQVFVGNTGGESGNIDWTFYGPIDAVNNSCQNLDWTNAPVLFTARQFITGDGTYTTTVPGDQITEGGCYSFGDVLSGQYWETVTLEPGIPAEVTSVRANPEIATIVNADGFSDDITLTNTGGFDGTLEWALFGPVTAGPGGDCNMADWTGAPTYATGVEQVSGNGTTTVTPNESPTAGGCYSYAAMLDGENFVAQTISEVGQATETFLRDANPTMVTRASISDEGNPPVGTMRDSIVIEGTVGLPGSVYWELVGPVAPLNDSCVGADYSAAAIVDSGNIAIDGDGTYTTPDITGITVPGCYGFNTELTGANMATVTSTTADAPEVAEFPTVTPVVATVASKLVPTPTTISLFDTITISESRGLAGIVNWRLLGPVDPTAGECPATGDAAWTTADVKAEGEIEFVGDGEYITPETEVDTLGCYTFDGVITGAFNTVNSEAGIPEETILLVNPTLKTTKVNDTDEADPGDVVKYTITAENTSTNPVLNGSFVDDLSEVIDDATYNGDVEVNFGAITYDAPNLSWQGIVPANETLVVTYSVTVNDPATGDGNMPNTVVMPYSNCEDGDELASSGRGFVASAVDFVLGSSTASAAAADDPDCNALTVLGLAETGQSLYLAVIGAVTLLGSLVPIHYIKGRMREDS